MKKKENNIEGIIERIYVQSEKLEIENHCRLVSWGVNENTADLCRGAKEQERSRTSLEIR